MSDSFMSIHLAPSKVFYEGYAIYKILKIWCQYVGVMSAILLIILYRESYTKSLISKDQCMGAAKGISIAQWIDSLLGRKIEFRDIFGIFSFFFA